MGVPLDECFCSGRMVFCGVGCMDISVSAGNEVCHMYDLHEYKRLPTADRTAALDLFSVPRKPF